MLIGTIVDGLFEDWMQPETAINCQILGYHPICRQTQMFGFNHEIRLIWIKSEYIADITFKKQQYKDFIFWDSPTKNKKNNTHWVSEGAPVDSTEMPWHPSSTLLILHWRGCMVIFTNSIHIHIPMIRHFHVHQ